MGTFDYYAAVVRQLPATDLARAAARRAVRMAHRALPRRERTDGADEVLDALGANDVGELPAKAFDGRLGLTWCEPAQRDSVRRALATIPGAQERAIARAEKAARREFDVFGHAVSFSEAGRTDWGLDPVAGVSFPLMPPGTFSSARAGLDPKYPWVIGRLDHLIALAQGAWVTGDDAARTRYAQTLVAELDDFLERNPVGLGVQWTCPMEVALRAANIAQALLMVSDLAPAREPGFVRRALGALIDHTRWVETHLEDEGFVPNNHLVSNHAGLLIVGLLFPELPDATRHVALASQGLKAELRAQVHPDGVSFEGSIPYHRLSVELFTLPLVIARGYGLDLGQEYDDRLQRMYAFARAYCSERGRAPQLGDNDSGRVFPLRDRPSLDHGYLAPLGAALFGDAELKAEGDTLCDEAAWLLGTAAVARFDRLPARYTPATFLSPAGGFSVLRAPGAVVTASTGTNGQRGIGGHSHNDKLAFELHVRGVPVLVDPGSPAYTRDAAMRNAFRATAAHNTPELDGVEQAPLDPARLFALPDTAHARVLRFDDATGVVRLAASHRGYAARGVEVERSWALDGERGVLCVTDLFRGTGLHRLTLRLHLGHASARLREVTAEERERAQAAVGTARAFAPRALEIELGGTEQAVVLVDEGARLALEPSGYSPGYGELVPALALLVQRAVQAPATLGFVVLWATR